MDGLTHRCTKLLEVALKLDIFFILPKGGRERKRQTDRQGETHTAEERMKETETEKLSLTDTRTYEYKDILTNKGGRRT